MCTFFQPSCVQKTRLTNESEVSSPSNRRISAGVCGRWVWQVDIEPVQQLVSKHIDGSKPLSNVGTEFSLKLPSAETSKVRRASVATCIVCRTRRGTRPSFFCCSVPVC